MRRVLRVLAETIVLCVVVLMVVQMLGAIGVVELTTIGLISLLYARIRLQRARRGAPATR